MWLLRTIENLVIDLRRATRSLQRQSQSSILVVLLLGLGMAVAAASVTLVDRVLFRSLPTLHPETLVLLGGTGADGAAVFGFPRTFVAQTRLEARSLSEVLAFSNTRLSVRADDAAEAVRGVLVSGNAFGLLMVRPLLGRILAANDDESANANVAVLSYGYWQRRFGGDRDVVGRALTINGQSFTVVGVLPRDFVGLSAGIAPQEIWLPMTGHSSDPFGGERRNFRILARLADNATYASSEAELTAIYRDVLAREPRSPLEHAGQSVSKARVKLVSAAQGVDGMGSRIGGAVRLAFGIALVLFLVICANIAGLLVVRGAARQHEMVIRLALGVSRARLAQQLFVENLLLCGLGGLVGLAGAWWISPTILDMIAWNPNVVPLVDLTPAWSTLSFIGAVSVGGAIVFSARSAQSARTVDVAMTLRAGGRGMSAGLRTARLTRGLVALQFAAALVLLLNGLLLVDAVRRIARSDPGFDSRHVLEFGVYPSTAGYKGAREQHLYREIADRIGTIPGVEAVSYSRRQLGLSAPLAECRLHPSPGAPVRAFVINVGPRFFETLRIPILQGRDFTASDGPESAAVAIVDHTVMTEVFGGDAVGKRFFYADGPSAGAEIIGVVASTRRFAMSEGRGVVTGCDVYIPVAQAPASLLGQMEFFARTAGVPEQQSIAVRRAVMAIDADLPLVGMSTTAEYVRQLYRREDGLTRLAGLLSAVSLIVAVVGLYGVLSFSVAGRTREIGIRSALGATSGAIVRAVLGEAFRVAAIGIGIGGIGFLVSQHLLGTFVYGLDEVRILPAMLAGTTLMLAALVGAYIPSRRAARVDPLIALRTD